MYFVPRFSKYSDALRYPDVKGLYLTYKVKDPFLNTKLTPLPSYFNKYTNWYVNNGKCRKLLERPLQSVPFNFIVRSRDRIFVFRPHLNLLPRSGSIRTENASIEINLRCRTGLYYPFILVFIHTVIGRIINFTDKVIIA